MRQFRRIYLLSYAVLFSVSLGLLASTYTLLPSRAGGSRDNVSDSFCYQDATSKFGLNVTCQEPAPEVIGTIWSYNNGLLIGTTVVPFIDGIFSPRFHARKSLAQRFEEQPGRLTRGVALTFAIMSPHLIALGLMLHWTFVRLTRRLQRTHQTL